MNSAAIKFFILFMSLIMIEVRGDIILAPVTEVHLLIKEGKSFSFNSPVGSYQKIIEWKKGNLYSCLFYKVPIRSEQLGELIKIEGVKVCSLRNLKKASSRIEGITSLKIQDIDLIKRPRFKLRYNIEEKEFIKELTFPFFSRENSMWPGIFIYESTTLLSDTNLVKEEVCRYGCKEDRSNNCQSCPGGHWTPFISLKCPASISAICGLRECGGKEQKACLKMTALKSQLTCEEAKKYVYCSYGLDVNCLNNGDIICR
jgi:hypothetical protein